MKKLVLALSVLGLAVAPALAQTADFTKVDADTDGQVTMEEVKAAGVALTDEQFAAADADGNGWLSEDEYKAAISG